MKIINPASFGRINPKDWRDIPNHYTSSIWPEKLPSKTSDYGSNSFHGRTSPDIIKVAVERYTCTTDVVWDCFAGSGTAIDVCKELHTECIANDINPIRPDIVKADSREWYPDIPIDLVICHPPYMDCIDFGDGVLSIPDLNVFQARMMDVFDSIRCVLKDWHVLVLIVGVVYKYSEMICLDYYMHDLLPDFRLLGRVVRPFGETKGGATSGKRNENLWRYRRLKYGIWELNQDVVLFLQKMPVR